jgi:hypothetical protein
MICYCTLTNTQACLTCPNYLNDRNTIKFNLPTVSREKIIEKYDENGKLFERIIEIGDYKSK